MRNYDPRNHGTVEAIRIYLEHGYQPMAELAFAFGGTETIEWNNIVERERYAPGINAYTLFYDERPKREFKDWVKPISYETPEFTCPSCGETFKFKDRSIKGFKDIEGCTCTCTGCGRELFVENGKFMDLYEILSKTYANYIEVE